MHVRGPLRLGVSTSSFIHVMDRELLKAAYIEPVWGEAGPLDDRLNEKMADFVSEILSTVEGSPIESVELYHSVAYDREKIVDRAKGANIEYWSMHMPYGKHLDLSSPIEEDRVRGIEAVKGGILAAHGLGAKVVVVHPGANIDHDVSKHTRLKHVAESLKEISDFAGEHDVRPAVEPLPKEEPGNSLDEVLWIIEECGRENVGVNFDVNHLFPASSIPGQIKKAGEMILSVHASDQDDEERHWLPLSGKLDWQGVMEALTSVGYAGPLIYETHIKDVSTVSEAVSVISANYLLLMDYSPTRVK